MLVGKPQREEDRKQTVTVFSVLFSNFYLSYENKKKK